MPIPTYLFRNKRTGSIREKFMSIAEMVQYIADHPNIETAVTAPTIVSGISTRIKPAKDFREILSEIKKRNPKGKVNDFGG